MRVDAAGDRSCQSVHVIPSSFLAGVAPHQWDGEQDGDGPVWQAPIRSLRPTDGRRVRDRARSTDRCRQSERTSAGYLESDLAWAPTHTLTSSVSGVVDPLSCRVQSSLPVWRSGGLTTVPNDAGLRDPPKE